MTYRACKTIAKFDALTRHYDALIGQYNMLSALHRPLLATPTNRRWLPDLLEDFDKMETMFDKRQQLLDELRQLNIERQQLLNKCKACDQKCD